MEENKQRIKIGGRVPNAGKPALSGKRGDGPSPTIHVRVTPAQKAKFLARGGADWLRRLLDAA